MASIMMVAFKKKPSDRRSNQFMQLYSRYGPRSSGWSSCCLFKLVMEQTYSFTKNRVGQFQSPLLSHDHHHRHHHRHHNHHHNRHHHHHHYHRPQQHHHCHHHRQCHRQQGVQDATTATATRTSKSNWLRLAKQQLCTCITLFCKFVCGRSTTTT